MSNPNNRYEFGNDLVGTKLKFIASSQSAIDSLITNGGAVDGAFYLTSDTQRLYVGRAIVDDTFTPTGDPEHKTIPVSVNSSIQTVSTTAALANIAGHSGDFYYINDSNILAVYNGTSWTQINPDTNDNDVIEVTSILIGNGQTVTGTYLKATGTYDENTTYYTCNGSSFSQVATSSNDNFNQYYIKSSDGGSTLIYTLTTKQKRTNISNQSTDLANIISYLVIPISDFAGSGKVGLTSTSVTTSTANPGGTTTLGTTGNLADGENVVKLVGAGSVSLSKDDNENLIITGDVYSITSTVTATEGIIKLKVGNTDKSSVTLSAGDHITFSGTSGITVNHTTPTTAATSTTVNTTISSSATTLKIPSISIDNKGHIVSTTDNEVNLQNIIPKSVSADNTGKITIQNKTNQNLVVSGQDLYYTLTIDKSSTTSTIYNQGYLGSFYSASAVDDLIAQKLKDINGLVYRGAIEGQGNPITAVPTNNVQIGDMYVVGDNITELTYNANSTTSSSTAHNVIPGDILIANSISGTEGADGYIATNNLYWTKISSGDIDTNYSLTINKTSKTLQLRNSVSPNTNQSEFSFVNGEKINIVASSTANSTIGSFTFNHAESGVISQTNVTSANYGINSTTSLSSGSTFKIPQFTVDRYGHLTSASDITLTLPQSNNDDYKLKNKSSDEASADAVLRLFKNNTIESSITLSGDTTNSGVIVSATNGTININHATLSLTTATAETQTLTNGGSITVITAIGTDSYGHISTATYKTYTLPSEYKLSGSTVTISDVTIPISATGTQKIGTKYKITNGLSQNNVNKGTVSYESETLAVTAVTTTTNGITDTTYTVNLVWESI